MRPSIPSLQVFIVITFASLLAMALKVVQTYHAQISSNNLVDELFKLEKSSWEMMKTRDVASIRKYATADFLWIFSDGTRVNSRDVEKYLQNYELASYKMSEAEVISFDDQAAVLVYKLTYVGGNKGEKHVSTTVWASSTYVKRGSDWKEILYQETLVK
jgi:hypothetical protein